MRVVLWMSSVILASAAAIGASRLWAEDKAKKPAPRTRIGLINLTYVIKNYDKFKQYEIEMKKLIEPFTQRHNELQSKLDELRKQATNPSLVPTSGENGREKTKDEEVEEKARKIQRDIEDNKAKIKLKMSKRSDDEMKVIYKDVMEATQCYATKYDLDLVLHYNDAITHEDLLSAQNVARKLNTGALMPLYSKEELDISMDIVTLLNQRMHKK